MATAPEPSKPGIPKAKKSHELAKSTIKAPAHAYAHIELFGAEPGAGIQLDAIQVRSYCSAALTQFLGVTGMAIPVDILKVDGRRCWLRVPRDDLGAFAAAVVAWQGTTLDGVCYSFRVRGCSDWLGALVGQEDEERLWTD
ncbi:hypothetical protein F4861DRAFT_522287 [Xylaria intraflava]|nr:hypothetical protein F4861DRAFT_522287 [Xylaria intraflava]